MTNDLRSDLAAQRSEVLAFLRRSDTSLSAADRVEPAGTEEAGELSYAQQRLWFLDRGLANRELYNVSGAFRLGGRVEVAGRKFALAENVRRRGWSRTQFLIDEARSAAV